MEGIASHSRRKSKVKIGLGDALRSLALALDLDAPGRAFYFRGVPFHRFSRAGFLPGWEFRNPARGAGRKLSR